MLIYLSVLEYNFVLFALPPKLSTTYACYIILIVYLQRKLHLFELEEEMKIEPLIKYVLYEVLTDILPSPHHQKIC